MTVHKQPDSTRKQDTLTLRDHTPSAALTKCSALPPFADPAAPPQEATAPGEDNKICIRQTDRPAKHIPTTALIHKFHQSATTDQPQ